MKEKMIIVGILYLGILAYLFYLITNSPKVSKLFLENYRFQIFIILLGILLTYYYKYLGILFLVGFVGLYFISNYEKEGFTVVEDDSQKIVNIERNSLLDRLQNEEGNVNGVWGCSYLGKNMGLCRG